MFGAAYPKISQSGKNEDESRRRKTVVAGAERVVKLQLLSQLGPSPSQRPFLTKQYHSYLHFFDLSNSHPSFT